MSSGNTAATAEIAAALEAAKASQAAWAATPVAERAALCSKAVDIFVAAAERHAEELAWQMGRPIRFGKSEVAGFEERARYMIEIAEQALGPVEAGEKAGFVRYVKREPLGLVLTVAPWNYPYLTAVNSVVPALMAGNAVLLKHASQTPLCGERMAEAFAKAGLPKGLLQVLHLSHAATGKLIGSEAVDFVAFTGSVPGGATIEAAGGQPFHRRRPGARRQGPGLRARRRRPRPRRREPGGRRLLQLRPVLLRHRAHLRARRPLRALRRRRRRPRRPVPARQPPRPGDHPGPLGQAPRPPTSCAARRPRPSPPAPRP